MKSLYAQFADWVAMKPADEGYDFMDAGKCALAQFGEHIGADHLVGMVTDDMPPHILDALNPADGAFTFGALAERLSVQVSR